MASKVGVSPLKGQISKNLSMLKVIDGTDVLTDKLF